MKKCFMLQFSIGLHVNISKSHVNIIISHVDKIYLACRRQKYIYAIIDSVSVAYLRIVREGTCLSNLIFLILRMTIDKTAFCLALTHSIKILWWHTYDLYTCKINHDNMQHDYVHMRLIYVNMQNYYVDMQHTYVNMRVC